MSHRLRERGAMRAGNYPDWNTRGLKLNDKTR